MLLKVCGMRDIENMRQLETVRPDYMGLIFHRPSPRYVDGNAIAEKVRQIALDKAGVFVNADHHTIIQHVSLFDLKMVQLHGDESVAFCTAIKSIGVKVAKVFGVGRVLNLEAMRPYEGHCDFFLFDTKTEARGGSGTKFDWGLLEEYKLSTPFILSGGISVDDAAQIAAILHTALVGVDINSRFELGPGIKNIEMVEEFKNKIEHGNR